MKKIFTLFVAAVCAMSMWAKEPDFQVGDFYYKIIGANEVELVNPSNDDTSFTSPNEYTDLKVADIPAEVEYNSNVYSVTTIEAGAFWGCSGLTSVTLGNSVTSIGDRAFEDCSGLTSITIPNSVTSIGDGAFEDCDGLTSVTIGNSVTSIGAWAFAGCLLTKENFINNSSLDAEDNGYWGAVIFDKEVDGVIIKNNEVVSCRKTVHSAIIPDGVTSIGDRAFEYCYGLTSITIPNSVTSIGYAAFYGCSSLTSITIPNSVTSIGDDAFYWCESLTSPVYNAHCFAYMPTSFEGAYSIPDGIKQIAGYAFRDCSSLTTITIPNSVTSIGYAAFSGCSSLISVTLGNSVTSIGDAAFYECSSLTSIVVEEGNTVYDSRENCNAIIEIASNTLITGCKNTIIPNSVTSIGNNAFYNCSGLTSITIPNSVTSIGDHAFEYCSALTSVTLGNSVTSIGYGAFYNCSGLTSIVVEEGNTVYDSRENCNAIIEIASNTLITGCKNTIIPNSVTSIGNQAFYNCSGLTSVTIPNSVTSIGDAAFEGCSGLTSVTIPNSVTSIGYWAFAWCYYLEKVSFKGKTPPAMGGDIFYYSNPTWVVPCGAYDVYASTEIAQQYGYAIEEYCIGGECGDYLTWTYDEDTHELAISGMYEMYDYVGSGPWGAYVNEITSITMEEGITYIGTDAFANCKYVQSLTIPASVEKIGNSAFENCRKLNEVNFAEEGALTEIGDWAFYNCHNLQDLTIPEGVTQLGDAAFFNCTYLKELTLPSTLMAVADNGFALCEKLAKMNVNAVVPPVVEARTFENVDRMIPVVVPSESVSAYKAAPVWQEFNIQGKDNVESDLENIGSDNGYGVMGNGKIIRNGQLIILRDGVEYNTLGQAL